MTGPGLATGELTAGARYQFHTRPVELPTGEVLPGEVKVRTFVRPREIGAVGAPTIPFVEVLRDNGTPHLIAVESIELILEA